MIESGGVTILKLNVESLDALTVPELRPAVEQLVERGGVKVVVDGQPATLDELPRWLNPAQAV